MFSIVSLSLNFNSFLHARDINFAPNGDLYVAEAGRGGPGPCVPSPVFPFPPRCYGETGAVTLILPNEASPAGSFRRVVTGLPSLALATGVVEGGASDVAFLGTAPYVTMGLGGNPSVRHQLGGKAGLFGTLLHATPSGQYRVVADIAGAEAAANPDGAAVDSNPYSVLVQPGRRIVADAGANALFVAHANGHAAVFAEDEATPSAAQRAPRINGKVASWRSLSFNGRSSGWQSVAVGKPGYNRGCA